MNCDTLTPKKLKGNSRYMFDWDEGSKTRLKQWQYILELETYITDVRGIWYGSSGACHMWRILLGEGGIHFGWHHEERKS